MSLNSLFKGWNGEMKIRLANKLFLGSRYRAFNHVTIGSGRLPTQIDHVLVSRYGVFCIETEDKTGWIYGDKVRDEWTQLIYRQRSYFPNPLIQNYHRAHSLAETLSIDISKIHPLIVFWGKCEFRTLMPPEVVKGDLLAEKLRTVISAKTEEVLQPEEVARICSILTRVKKRGGILSRWKHSREIRQRYRGKIIYLKGDRS
jgi:hypothetical protein